jgi:hypothetical protein
VVVGKLLRTVAAAALHALSQASGQITCSRVHPRRELATAKHARSGAPVIARHPSGMLEVENNLSLFTCTRRAAELLLTALRVFVSSVSVFLS